MFSKIRPHCVWPFFCEAEGRRTGVSCRLTSSANLLRVTPTIRRFGSNQTPKWRTLRRRCSPRRCRVGVDAAQLRLVSRIVVDLIYATVEMLFGEPLDTKAVARTVVGMLASHLPRVRPDAGRTRSAKTRASAP
jgi:hypothetical protein